MIRKYKIRFNLGKGKRYKTWKISHTQLKECDYFSPNTHSFILFNCKLKNNKKTAQKIFEGANKTVCAWIEFENYECYSGSFLKKSKEIKYNPKIFPNWVIDGKNVDNTEYQVLFTDGRKIYIYE